MLLVGEVSQGNLWVHLERPLRLHRQHLGVGIAWIVGMPGQQLRYAIGVSNKDVDGDGHLARDGCRPGLSAERDRPAG